VASAPPSPGLATSLLGRADDVAMLTYYYRQQPGCRSRYSCSRRISALSRVVFVIQSSGGYQVRGAGDGSPPVESRGEPPVGDLGTMSAEAEAFFINFKQIFSKPVTFIYR